jgi:hypothetical protein
VGFAVWFNPGGAPPGVTTEGEAAIEETLDGEGAGFSIGICICFIDVFDIPGELDAWAALIIFEYEFAPINGGGGGCDII